MALADDFVLELSKPVQPKPADATVLPAVQDFRLDTKVQDPLTRNPLERWVIDPVMRGVEGGWQRVDAMRFLSGNMTPEEFARKTYEHDYAKLANPSHPDDLAAMDAIQKADGWNKIGALFQNPSVIPQTLFESVPLMGVTTGAGLTAGAAGGAMAGPEGAALGGVAGTFAGSFMGEFSQSIVDAVRARGEVVDEASLARALHDPQVITEARDYAVKRGIPVAAFDAISFGLAGKFFGPVEKVLARAGAPAIAGRMAGAGAEGIAGGIGGASGEAGAQLASTGQINDPAAVLLEGAAEMPGAGLDIAAKAVSGGHAASVPGEPSADPGQLPLPIPTTGPDDANVQVVDPGDFVLEPPLAPATPVAPVAPVETAPQPEPATVSVDTPPTVPSQAPASTPQVSLPKQPGTGSEKVTTPDKSFETDTQFEVIDADQLKAAAGEDQPRDRANRGASAGQIAQIASRLDPLDLLSSRNSDSGAPIVDENNVILSGNGRTAAIIRAAENHPERYAAYRATLEGLGYDTSKLKVPVLVRRAKGIPADKRRLFTTRSNVSANQTFSAPERARTDQDYISPDMLAGYDAEVEDGVSAASNRQFATQFIKNMPAAEHNMMVTANGELSTEGAARIQNAIFAKAYGDKRLIDKTAETNADPALRNALLGAAAAWANMREKAPSFDVTGDLVEAINLLNAARGKGMTVDNYLAQADAFASPPSERVQNLARLFLNKDGTRLAAWKDVRDRLRAIAADGARSSAAEGDIFGGKPNVDQTIKNVRQKAGQTTEPDTPASAAKTSEGEPNLFGGETLSKKPLSGKAAPPSEGLFAQPEPEAKPAHAKAVEPETFSQLGKPPEQKKAAAKMEDAAPDELGDDRRPRGTLAPQTEDVSMTTRRSVYEEAFRAAGLDPDEGVLLPPKRKLEVLRSLLVQTFGFASLDTTGANIKDATNQMLDAYRNVRFMMHALALPVKGVSLNGTLSLHLERAGKRYFGVYVPDMRAIGLPGRSNSFAHEWAHALDHFLGDALKGDPKQLLSHITRGEGLDPNVSIENAFINLLHTMFFDEAGVAAEALRLETEAAATIKEGPRAGQPTAKAIEAQKSLERLQAGATRLKLPDSEYRARSKQYDPGSDYWASVHEMLARAFEAYVASKVEALGGTNEFITKGEAAYLSDADRRLDLTFPKGVNRDAIFAAFDDVLHHIRNQSILGTGPSAPKPADTDIVDPQHWNKIVLAKGNPTVFEAVQKEAFAVRNAAQNAIDKGLPQSLKDGVSHIATNAGINQNVGLGKVGQTALDTVRFWLFSLRGAIRPRIARNKGKGSTLMQEVFDRFATVNGDGRWHGQTYEDARQQDSSKDINRIESALRGNGFEKLALSKPDNEAARELLFGRKVPGARPEIVKLAAALRRIMEDAHSAMEKAGIQIGYVTDKGYLPRVLNPTKVQTDPKGFQSDAEKVYRLVFDRIVADPEFGPKEVLGLSREVNQRLGDTTGVSRFAAEEEAVHEAVDKLNKALAKLERFTEPKAKATPAEIDAVKAEVKAARQAVRDAVDALAAELRDPYAEVSAIDWRTRVQIGDSVTYDSHGPAANFTKHRTLPPETDEIMANWYNTDVVNLTANYVQQAHGRVAYVQRAGNSSGTSRIQDVMSRKDVQNRMNAHSAARTKYGVGRDVNDMTEAQRLAIIKDFANTKTDNVLEMLYREAERSGADAGDIKALRGAVETMTGRGDRAPLSDYYNRFSGLIYVYTYLRLLPRAAITSLTEPVSVLLRTGDLGAMFSTFTNYLGELNQSAKSVQERQAIARAIGLTTSPLYDTILMSRMGMDHGHITSGNVLLANYFKANFLTGITNAQRRSVMAGGFQWLRDMAVKHGKTDAAHKKMIEAEFRELGVRDEDMSSFMDWLKQGDTIPDLDALNSKAGRMFEHAIHRLTGQIIQDPRRADKPMPASSPLGRVVYSLTAYLYSFFSNVHAATVSRAVRNFRIGKEAGLSTGQAAANAAVPAAASFVGGFALLFLGQLMVSLLRESLFNGEPWEKHRKDGDLFNWLTQLSASRTGIAGPADLILNAMTGLKYERDLSNMLVGPGFSSIFSDLQNIAGLWATNSPNTNTAERNAANGVYRLLVAPLLSGVLTALDVAGPAGAGARYTGMIAVTSNAAASKFADMVAGEQKRLKKGDPGYVKPSE